MLTTDQFVMINFPKTGSTFARTALLRAHQRGRIGRVLERFGVLRPEVQEHWMVPFFFTSTQEAAAGKVAQHGTFHQIPAAHRLKPVFTVVRDPVQRVISAYEFRSWERNPFPDVARIKAEFPSFPDLSFENFLRMGRTFNRRYAQPEGMQVEIGGLTTQFIRFYARDPLKTILALREDTDWTKEYDRHFPEIRFLHTERLNRELYDFLLEMGYPKERIAFILEMGKINRSKRTRSNYCTAEQIARIQHDERFFYQLFPEYLQPDH
jgi:hypothetical protein